MIPVFVPFLKFAAASLFNKVLIGGLISAVIGGGWFLFKRGIYNEGYAQGKKEVIEQIEDEKAIANEQANELRLIFDDKNHARKNDAGSDTPDETAIKIFDQVSK